MIILFAIAVMLAAITYIGALVWFIGDFIYETFIRPEPEPENNGWCRVLQQQREAENQQHEPF